MKTFRTVVVLKRPRNLLWTAMRDQLHEVVAHVPDIESIKEIERAAENDGTIRIVNEWRPRYPLPPGLRTLFGGELGWTDRNSWDENIHVCTWAIEPFFLSEHIDCAGTTVFEPALAGQGTKVTLEGTLELRPGILSVIGMGSQGPLTTVLESVLTSVIPKNLRAILEAASVTASVASQPSRTL
jgi:hypothetical protein